MNDDVSAGPGFTRISVRGEASVEVAPERATVNVVIDVDGAERAEVQQRGADARAECIASARALHSATAGPITEWSAGQLQAWSSRPWNADGAQLPLVFHSRSTVTATFSDLEAVGAWTDAVSENDGVTLAGIDWSITDLTQQELEARCQRDAVANAVAKASVYASALGLGDVRPIAITEPATLSDGPLEFGSMSKIAMASAGPSTEFTPELLRIVVQVNARFDARPAAG